MSENIKKTSWPIDRMLAILAPESAEFDKSRLSSLETLANQLVEKGERLGRNLPADALLNGASHVDDNEAEDPGKLLER